MKQQLRNLLLPLLTIILCACASNQGASYSPGGDPLVNAYFESYLYREKIAYVRERNGNYSTLRDRDRSKMSKLGEQARQIEPGRGSIEVSSPCVQDKLQSQLRAAGVIYARVQEAGKTVLVMTQSDFDAQSIPTRYAEYVAQCEPWGEQDK